jgi:exodeoxyribonuclease VII large subunit
MEDQSGRLVQAFQGRLSGLRWELESRRSQLHRLSPGNLIRNNLQRLDDLSRRSRSALENGLLLRRTRMEGLRVYLESLNPLAVLARGYAIVTHATSGALVRSVRQVLTGDNLEVQVQDGIFPAKVLPPGSQPPSSTGGDQ